MKVEEVCLFLITAMFAITATVYLVAVIIKTVAQKNECSRTRERDIKRLLHEYGKVVDERNALRQELADAEAYVRRCRTNGEWVSTCERDQLLATIRNQQKIIKNLNRQVERNNKGE